MSAALQILLIEDSETDRTLIERLLVKAFGEGCQVTHNSSLSAALGRLTSTRFDAVLLDLTLPDSSGPVACDKIRDTCRETPVIVMTGVDDEQVALQSLTRGAQEFLVKGQTDARMLARAVRYAIERKRSEAELQQAHRRLQQQLHQAELAHLARLNTMGEMASGMAHELNQPLTSLVGFAESALAGLDSGNLLEEDLRHVLHRVVSESQRAAEIIRRLRRLVRKREPEQSPTDLNEVVREVLEIVEYETEVLRCKVQLDLADGLPLVGSDRVQIQQVLLNLIRNGMEAMDSLPDDERVLTVRTEFDENVIRAAVSDNGLEIEEQTVSRLLEPYFTTKKSGLGLGLAICRTIIESHAGQLTVTSNADRGLTVAFTLRRSGSA
ncbi:MAG: response regulator [Planctomycetota bacterium]|nr:response regulator [Planctomycetota bacterium]